MGVVVAARHVTLDRQVALKFLKREAVERPEAVERFVREARAASAITSEYVVRILDVGTLEDGRPYMVMEHLTGQDAAAVVDERPLGVEEAVGFILQVCQAIAEAHRLGIVHRDLKPSNLFLTQHPDGSQQVKVLDFGIAKALGEESSGVDGSLTATGMALGSPAYMAPEQVRDAKSADRRTDIWGIGAVLYELLARQAPFDADTLPALSAKIIADEPQPLNELRDDVPAGLEAVVARCLEKRPADRYPDVALLADDLEPFAPVEAKPLVRRIRRVVSSEGSVPEATASGSGREGLAHAQQDNAQPSEASPLSVTTADGVAATASRPASEAAGPSFARRAMAIGAVAVLGVAGLALAVEGDSSSSRLSSAMASAAAQAVEPTATKRDAVDSGEAQPTPTSEATTEPVVTARSESRAPAPAPPTRVVEPPTPQPRPQPVVKDEPLDPLSDRK